MKFSAIPLRYLIAASLLLLTLALLLATTSQTEAAPLLPPLPEGAEGLPPGATVETLLSGMDKPIAMAFDPDGRLFYTEKASGNVRLYADGVLQPNPVIRFQVNSQGERGLIGIAIDPNFRANRYIYAFYTCDQAGGCFDTENKVVRFTEQGGIGSNPQLIFRSDQPATWHVGGNIHFGPDGKLYITLGESGNQYWPQDLRFTQGKIHRINPDGTIPADNPFVNSPGALPSIYAYGMRNTFDFTFDSLIPGRMFASENGPSCDDELNRIEPGHNYGWRVNYECEPDPDDNPDPRYNTIPPMWYLHFREGCCQSPTGITVYTGSQIPSWRDHLFMAFYGGVGGGNGALRRFYLNADRTQVTAVNIVARGVVTANLDIETGPDGALWYIEGGGYRPGSLKRIVGPGCAGSFTDVPSGSTFEPFVSCLVGRGIISGYADCTFRPGNNITRGQLAKVVANAAGWTEPVAGQTFTDVPTTDPFYAFIERMAQRGVISGYTDGTFRPGNSATRGQISKIVATAAGFSEERTSQTFTDVPPGSTFHPYVERMAARGIIGGYADNTFRPDNVATRGQVSKIVANTFFSECAP